MPAGGRLPPPQNHPDRLGGRHQLLPTGPADYRLRQLLAEFTGLSGLTPNREVALVKRSAVVLTAMAATHTARKVHHTGSEDGPAPPGSGNVRTQRATCGTRP